MSEVVYISAANVELTTEDLRAIENASSNIKVEGFGIRNRLSRQPEGE